MIGNLKEHLLREWGLFTGRLYLVFLDSTILFGTFQRLDWNTFLRENSIRSSFLSCLQMVCSIFLEIPYLVFCLGHKCIWSLRGNELDIGPSECCDRIFSCFYLHVLLRMPRTQGPACFLHRQFLRVVFVWVILRDKMRQKTGLLIACFKIVGSPSFIFLTFKSNHCEHSIHLGSYHATPQEFGIQGTSANLPMLCHD